MHNFYSQTLENKSSLAAKLPAGLAGVAPIPGVTGAALLQPPKSSSALTLGAGLLIPNPPSLPPPGTILWLAKEFVPAPQPKLPVLACGGVGLLIAGLAAELQASFEPQASVLPHPLMAAGGGWAFA